MKEKIIQLMPLPVPGHEFQQADVTRSYNEKLQVVGAALTDTGRLLTVCYDNRFSFRILDPAAKQTIHNIERALNSFLERQ